MLIHLYYANKCHLYFGGFESQTMIDFNSIYSSRAI